MRRLLPLALMLTALWWALAPAPGAANDTWQVDEASTVGFTAFQNGRPVEGRFEDFVAEIAFDRDDLAASRFDVEIDMTSVATGHRDRDETLRSSDFFATERFPSARFVSSSITAA